MNSPSRTNTDPVAPRQTGITVDIDVKRIVYHALRFWYLVVGSLLICLAVAFFKVRYATKIYPVSASIIIKEKEETSEGRLLYNNPLVSGFRNYLNELYIIRSHPLIEQTLQELNFGVAFAKEGNVLTTEIYEFPVQASVLSSDAAYRFDFEAVNPQQFRLFQAAAEEVINSPLYSFGDTIEFQGMRAVFAARAGVNMQGILGERFVFSYNPPSGITSAYVSRLGASWAEEGAGVINLSINGPIPAKEIEFLNGLIRQYQLLDLQKKNQVATRTIEFINDQLTDIADSLQQVESRLETFKDKNLMTDLGTEATRLYSKVEAIEAQRAELRIRSNYYKYVSEYLRGDNYLEQVVLPGAIGINDAVLASLTTNMVELQTRIQLNQRSENPLYGEAVKLLEKVRRDIQEAVQSLQATDRIKEDFLKNQLTLLEGELGRLPASERQMVSIQRNYGLLENLYVFLLQKRAEAGISRASTTSDIAIVNPPMVTGVFTSPQPRTAYLLALLVGLAIPVSVFVLMEILNTRVQSREDVERITNIPFIGGVGHKRSDNNLEVFRVPKSSIAESFRALRSGLQYFLQGQEKAVIVVSSSVSGEGKTFTTINLASVFALAGRKTLIIGADMRRPKIFQDFTISNEKGLSTFLAGIHSFQEVVQPSGFPLLDVVSGGPVPPNPAELLLTGKTKAFVDVARAEYDCVIIDTPPLAIVTDAFALTGFANHIVFVVRQNYTPKDALRNAQQLYDGGKLANVSIVLNDIFRSGPGYGYGYSYDYSYGYGYGNKKHRNGHGYYED